MRKLICLVAMLIMFFFNMITLAKDEQKTETDMEIIHVEAEPIEIKSEPVVEEVKIVESTKTKAEIKNEEFNNKLNDIEYLKKESNEEWFLAYKDLTYEYVEWVKMPETIYDVFSEEEINLICRVVETETYDQDFDSKVNVANVVFNRLDDGRFGDTITEIVTNPKQFAYGRKKITESSILAVMYAYEMEDTTQGALYFNSFKEAPEVFNGANYIDTDKCGHHFYGLKEE